MTLDTLSEINCDLKKTAKEDLEEARAEKRAEKKKAEKSAEQKRADKKEREERMEKSSDPEKEERIKDSEPNNNPTDTVFVNIIADSMTPSTGTIDPIGTKVDVNA
jgi:sRNA-binding protein